MARYPTGAPVRVSTEVRDTSGVLVTPGSIILRVRKPDATFIADYTTPVADAVGKYHQDLSAADLVAPGHYSYAWITTGTAAGVATGGLEVFDPFQTDLLSLQDAKDYLGETGTEQDEEIRAFARVATEVVESIVGPCTPQTFTEEVIPCAGGYVLLLQQRPIISVTSITSVWGPSPTWATGSLIINKVNGAVRLLNMGSFYQGPFIVTYTAGRTVIPDRFIHAAREMLRHLWTTQRGQTIDSPLPDFIGDEQFGAGVPFGSSFSIPNRVTELLAADRIMGPA